MANKYKNAFFDLQTTDKTDVYTAPSNARAIVNTVSYTHLTLPTKLEV